jgi:hypothetical protein
MENMGIHEGQQASLTPLAADTRLLVSTEDGLRSRLLPAVDEDASCLETARNLKCMVDILAPDAGAETGVGVVGAGDDFLLVRPGLSGHDRTCLLVSIFVSQNEKKVSVGRTEWLFLDDPGVVWRVVDDSRLNEKALVGVDVRLADGKLVALLLTVLEEALDLLELHGVLDGAESDIGFVAGADLEVLCEADHFLEELLVDGLVDVDALGGNTDLIDD